MTGISPAQAAFEAFHSVGDDAGLGTTKAWADVRDLPRRAFTAAARAAIEAGMSRVMAQSARYKSERDELQAGIARLGEALTEARGQLADSRELTADVLAPDRWVSRDGKQVLTVHPDHLASWRLRAEAGKPPGEATASRLAVVVIEEEPPPSWANEDLSAYAEDAPEKATASSEDDGDCYVTIRVLVPDYVDLDQVDEIEKAAQEWVNEQWPAGADDAEDAELPDDEESE